VNTSAAVAPACLQGVTLALCATTIAAQTTDTISSSASTGDSLTEIYGVEVERKF
jgi:hypothetical protein